MSVGKLPNMGKLSRDSASVEVTVSRLIGATRFLILVPIVALFIAAALIFVFGGIGLLSLGFERILVALGISHEAVETDSSLVIVELLEFVHMFLVGTVVYITAIGLYQLFIHEIELPHWLEIHNTEQLETNLISVTVVVLAVHLMGTVLVGSAEDLLDFGAGIALPIAALALFVGLRAWATSLERKGAVSRTSARSSPGNESGVQGAAQH